ncbi:MAG: hypothetical protein IT191_06345 [Microbacteriaceae bacterium]|nr:hypothetical protein [Microbacteriaceae bacterium]
MTLGLPFHLAPNVIRRAFVAAQHTFAATLLGIALVTVLVMQAADTQWAIWPAAILILPGLVLLFVSDRDESILWSIFYVVVGGLGTFASGLVLSRFDQDLQIGTNTVLSCTAISVLMVAGPPRGLLSLLAWTVIGFLVGGGAILLGNLVVGVSLTPALVTLAAFIGTVLVVPLLSHVNRLHHLAQPSLQRAANEVQMAQLRSALELKSAAIMHDTVLNHLAVIANWKSEIVDPGLREELRRDLDAMTSDDWLLDLDSGIDAHKPLDWRSSPLALAIRDAAAMGLDIEITGDMSACLRLDHECATALGLAVKQCLVNVLRHSGTTRAEVSAFASPTEISVMVSDEGNGFNVAENGGDRLGLRASVIKRIQAVDGVARVWSLPGEGTSILLTLPIQSKKPVIAKRSRDDEPRGGET